MMRDDDSRKLPSRGIDTPCLSLHGTIIYEFVAVASRNRACQNTLRVSRVFEDVDTCRGRESQLGETRLENDVDSDWFSVWDLVEDSESSFFGFILYSYIFVSLLFNLGFTVLEMIVALV